MILEAIKLKKVLDLIKPCENLKPTLEIIRSSSILSIGANYGDKYYIEYTLVEESDCDDEEFYLVSSQETFQKIHQLVTLWPKCTLQIDTQGEHQIVEIINNGALTRERPVHVDCVFEISENDYALTAPEVQPNCSVNSKNLRQMLEFCQVQTEGSGVVITMEKTALKINNDIGTLGTRVETEETNIVSSGQMILSTEANQLIISFLKGLGRGVHTIYLLFLETKYAFSIQVNLSSNEKIQIYSIHES